MIEVVFHPYAMSAFLNIPISVFYNQEVSGYGLENKKLNCLTDENFDCDDNDLCISLIEQMVILTTKNQLYHKTWSGYKTGLRQSFIKCILLPILQSQNWHLLPAWARNNLNAYFLRQSGWIRKNMQWIVRFQKSLKLMQNQTEISVKPDSLSMRLFRPIAFHKRIQELSRYTPLSLIKICDSYSDLFTTPI